MDNDVQFFTSTPPWEWPDDAGARLVEVFTNPQAPEAEREIAASFAGEMTAINDRVASALLAVVSSSDEPTELRARAAIALGPVLEQGDLMGFDDPDDVPVSESTWKKIQKTLRQVYADEGVPKEVRRRALEASVRAPDDWHEAAIQQAGSSGDREWMLTAAFAMRFVDGFHDEILDLLKQPDEEIHMEAVSAAGAQQVQEAWQHVRQLVEDPDTPKPLLLAAIEALGGIRPEEAAEVVVDLADSDDEDIAGAAEDVLSQSRADEEDEDSDWLK